MAKQQFTIGIEEEFQTVHPQTGELLSSIHPLLERGLPLFGDKIKPEMLQPTIELVSDVYPDITSARTAMHQQRAALAKFMHEQGIALISAGTHPSALWQEQKITEGERYIRQIKEEQVIYKKLSVC